MYLNFHIAKKSLVCNKLYNSKNFLEQLTISVIGLAVIPMALFPLLELKIRNHVNDDTFSGFFVFVRIFGFFRKTAEHTLKKQ